MVGCILFRKQSEVSGNMTLCSCEQQTAKANYNAIMEKLYWQQGKNKNNIWKIS